MWLLGPQHHCLSYRTIPIGLHRLLNRHSPGTTGLCKAAHSLEFSSSLHAFMYLSCMKDSIFNTYLDTDGGGGCFSSPKCCAHTWEGWDQTPGAGQPLARDGCLLPPTVTVVLWRWVIHMNSIPHFPSEVLWRNATAKTLDLSRGGTAITLASFHMLLTKKCRRRCRIQILSE